MQCPFYYTQLAKLSIDPVRGFLISSLLACSPTPVSSRHHSARKSPCTAHRKTSGVVCHLRMLSEFCTSYLSLLLPWFAPVWTQGWLFHDWSVVQFNMPSSCCSVVSALTIGSYSFAPSIPLGCACMHARVLTSMCMCSCVCAYVCVWMCICV